MFDNIGELFQRRKSPSKSKPKSPTAIHPSGRKEPELSRGQRSIAKLRKQVGGFLFQLVTLALFLSVFGWWGYTQVMKQVLGRFDVLDWESAGATLYGTPKVLLIDPIRTEEFLRPDTSKHDTLWPYHERMDDWPLLDTLWYAPGIPHHSKEGFEAWELIGQEENKQAGMADPWKELLFRKKVSFTLAQEPALTAIPDGTTLIILPGTLLMSAAEKKGVKDFLMDGGKLLACWSPGCRDERGEWAGYTFLEQIVGGSLAGLVTDTTGGETILLNGDGPITAMIPPGQHLEFFTWNGNIKLDILESRTITDAWEFEPYWHNAGRDAAGYRPALAAHGSYVKGKFVWFCFTPDAMQPHKDNYEMMEKLAMNAINWLSGKPFADISVWPSGYSAGGSLLVTGKGSPSAISELRNSIDPELKPLDLILDPDDIPKDVNFFGNEWGDVVLGSNDTSIFRSLNPRDLFHWLETRSVVIENLTGRRPMGLFPPNWNYNEFASVGAATEKMRFVMASPNPRFYGPTESLLRPHGWWIFSKKVQLATLPKCQVSTDEWVDYGGVQGASGIYSAMNNDLIRIRKLGGMYVGIFDPEILEEENALNLPASIAARMDSLGFWRGSTGEVMDRFSGWRGMRAATMEITPNRLQLQISNESDVDLSDVKIEVYYTPDAISKLEVTSQVLGINVANVKWNKRAGLLSFSLPEVKAKVNATMFLDATIEEKSAQDNKK